MRKIKFLAALLCVVLGAAATRAQVSFGNAEKFNGGWLFSLTDSAAYASSAFDDSGWRKLSLPHDWSIEGRMSPDLASCTGYLPGGIGWYRKHFTVEDDDQRRYIYFEGVYNRSEVYLNGHLLGKRPNGFISFLYDMTPYLKAGDNVLSVRVDHSLSADCRWYSGSGIYRDVWMVTAGDVHFAQWGVAWHASAISDSRATISVDVEVEKHQPLKQTAQVTATLYDREHNKVAQTKRKLADASQGKSKLSLSLNVKNPQRWSVDSPYLYTLETTITVDGKQADASTTRVGLRTIAFEPNTGFTLNGKSMKLKGVCLHHDAGVLGAVVPRDVWQRRLTNLKKYLGANAIRMSHNPQAPMVYDLCDEIGLLVMDEASDEWEFPKRKWLDGWNVGTPGFQGTYDFFEEWIDRDVADMVLRDRNHPSVIMWSIGNEVDYPNDPYSHPVLDGSKINQPMFGGYKPDAPDAMRIGKIAKRLSAIVRSIDSSRPVTGALAGVVMSNETEYPEAVDVVGYNYTEDRYAIDHQKYPERIIYGSENSLSFGNWKAVRDNDYISGQFIWTGIDYLGESRAWPSRGLGSGMLDYMALPKPKGNFLASMWQETPFAYIGTDVGGAVWDVWNYRDGEMVTVTCYTNCPQARLMLNGKQVGETAEHNDETGVIKWSIPYSAGKLTVEGCDKQGDKIADYTIQTSGLPYALRVTADKQQLTAAESVAHLLLEVVDENGVAVKLADNNITCSVEGPARLLGLENGDLTDMSEHRDNRQRVYMGKLLAYVQPTGGSGEVKVRFSSPLLQDAEVTLTVNLPQNSH